MLSLFPPPGPSLPSFSTLLAKGAYHPSAPLHLATSHVLESPQHEVLILSPSRPKLEKKLLSGLDEWLAQSGTTNRIKAAMSRIIILYPPSPAHFALLVAILDGTQSTSELTYLWGDLAVFPSENLSLIILDEISSYFTDTDPVSPELSFMSLMNRLMQSVNRISAIRDTPNSIFIACFESTLLGRRCTEGQAYDLRRSVHLESVVIGFFQWVCHFDELEVVQDVPSSQDDENSLLAGGEKRTRKCVRISTGGDGDDQTSVEYTEVFTPCVDRPSILQFLWQ